MVMIVMMTMMAMKTNTIGGLILQDFLCRPPRQLDGWLDSGWVPVPVHGWLDVLRDGSLETCFPGKIADG